MSDVAVVTRAADHGYCQGAIDMHDEASYICDNCGEESVVPIDFSGGGDQEYTEDCPVCCHPNVITVDVDVDGVVVITARPE